MEGLDRPAWSPARQCTGTNRAGERCQRQPIPGGSVCVMHGGAIPAVQASAKTRLLAMVEPVLGVFEDILAIWRSTRCTGCGHVDEHGNKCVGCGKPTGDPMPVIRVGQLVLDRAGFHPSLTVEQVRPHTTSAPTMTVFEVADRAELIARRARALADEEAARLQRNALPEVTDGVLLDEGFEVPEDEPEAPAAWSIPSGEPRAGELERTKTEESPENARGNEDE